MGGFQDLPGQLEQNLTSEECNERNILPVELGGSTGNRGRLCCILLTFAYFPDIPFGQE